MAVTQESLSWISETFDLGLHRDCWGENEVFGLGALVVQPEVVQASEVNAAAESTELIEVKWTKYSESHFILAV